ncbi:pyruvate, phosphate dikinase [Sulfuriroseicoccus oceanibius]|uniref:Pyruvate, phosphate dikinase n=1 Tax=Sulfuriroseicoccus oceanibius TaxID=2707525 RepID=A0A6B3L6C8_9BACT|nr:pyruvate, phosphate dikinase [Sulfuriroseicoccus oceanibius]QQL45487.1 pyruvate, phosphate dikinase [Sulfuriroseicoccus oceanibius]
MAESNNNSPATEAARVIEGKNVYFFGGGQADGDGTFRELLGGKGANLAEMSRIGLPVPAGFTISTEVCTYYYDNGRTLPATLDDEVKENLGKIEETMGKKFGDVNNPLLLSVRSGARDSMPGMMDTILNLGINDEVVAGLAAKTGNERFAYDSYRRFLQMYGEVVMGVEQYEDEHHDPFEAIIDAACEKRGVAVDTGLTGEDLKGIVEAFKALIKERTGNDFPQDPMTQLWGAVKAVFTSWNNDRAKVYRRKYGIPAEWGTAVNVQAMVFGNSGQTSGTGVAFTRDPASGENVFYGEYLVDAQGEDVVAGVRTPKPVAEMVNDLPKSYEELLEVRQKLENHFKDVQDLEFTVEDGKLYILQTRNGKRTGLAAVHIAIDMVNEGLIQKEDAIRRIPAEDLEHMLAPIFDAKAEREANKIGKGLPAGPGAACGRIYFHAPDAVAAAARGEKVVLTRVETSPEDLRGMIAAEGILTSRGGVSSHAALVARQMGKICVCGAAEVEIDYANATVKAGGVTIKEGEYISINGTTGDIYAGEIKTAPSRVVQGLIQGDAEAMSHDDYKKFAQLISWADELRKLNVRTNSDSPEQVKNAIAFGAEGIGLTRTEHMFFEGDRIDAVREMILADSENARREAVAKLLPYQKEDFVGIFTALEGRPGTIRLLDPPLHEFLPHTKEQQLDLANKMGIQVEEIMRRVAELHEFNPMLGHRGCRLGIVFPEITEMQARAILEAAAEVDGAKPEIMVPLVGFKKELDLQKEVIDTVAGEVREKYGLTEDQLAYTVGTMIEVPRAALTANEIAETAEFFSFGTNDLTQTCLGMSRDDAGGFLNEYQEQEIVTTNPFASLDQTGVGQLVEMGVEKGRSTRPGLKVGICGEHGGDPNSVKFCHKAGLDYVSCSPFRIPIAKLAAAQAALAEKEGK